MASTGVGSLEAHEVPNSISQSPHPLSVCSHKSLPFKVSVRSGPLANLSSFQDHVGSIYRMAQIQCFEPDPVMVFTDICDPRVESHSLANADEVRFIF